MHVYLCASLYVGDGMGSSLYAFISVSTCLNLCFTVCVVVLFVVLIYLCAPQLWVYLCIYVFKCYFGIVYIYMSVLVYICQCVCMHVHVYIPVGFSVYPSVFAMTCLRK